MRTNEDRKFMTAGEDFVRKIGPLGAALFLLLGAAVTFLLFTTGRDPIPGYSPPQDTAYYAAHLSELQAELETNVFPALSGIVSCHETDGRLEIVIRKEDFAVTRSAILRYFAESLFHLTEEGGTG
jgi:hypothetical protein